METKSDNITLDKVGLRKHYFTLTESQKKFVRCIYKWSQKPRKLLVVVSGGPGTGKSYVVKQTLNYVKVEQLRMSFTARSAQAIGGQTIHSAIELNFRGLCRELEKKLAEEKDLKTAIEKSKDILNEFHYTRDPYIVVIDEVSMVNGWLMYWLIQFFMERTQLPLLFIAIGDPHQLNPVNSNHNLFSFTSEQYPMLTIHLKESKRFIPEYEVLIHELRICVNNKNESDLFTLLTKHFPFVEDIHGDHLRQADRAMAATNKRVEVFNSYYLKNMVEGPEIKLETNLIVKPSCIVFVTKNGCSSVTNGTELRFLRYSNDRAFCTHPITKKEIIIRRDPETKRFPLMLGFAATIHKFQGETIDCAKIVIHFDGKRDLNMAYTAVSRVKSMNQILAIALGGSTNEL